MAKLTEAGKTFNEKAGAGVIGVADDSEVAVMAMGGLIAICRFELCQEMMFFIPYSEKGSMCCRSHVDRYVKKCLPGFRSMCDQSAVIPLTSATSTPM